MFITSKASLNPARSRSICRYTSIFKSYVFLKPTRKKKKKKGEKGWFFFFFFFLKQPNMKKGVQTCALLMILMINCIMTSWCSDKHCGSVIWYTKVYKKKKKKRKRWVRKSDQNKRGAEFEKKKSTSKWVFSLVTQENQWIASKATMDPPSVSLAAAAIICVATRRVRAFSFWDGWLWMMRWWWGWWIIHDT